MNNTVTILALTILCILLFVQTGLIYYILAQRRFKISNINTELESFLNQLFDVSTKSNIDVTKLINSFDGNLQKYDNNQEKQKRLLIGLLII